MWSDRPPIESVPAAQLATARCDEAGYAAFVAAVTARAQAPFEGPDPECHIPRFGIRPRAVLLQHQQGVLVVRSTTRDVELANATLHAFMDSTGRNAADGVGLELGLSPGMVLVPRDQRRRWLHLPRAGELEPSYRVYVPPQGEPKVSFVSWMSRPTELACMGGHEVRFELWDPPTEDEVTLIDAAMTNLAAAGPELLASATEPVFQYYQDIAGEFSRERRADYGIPEIDRAADVWQHVRLDRTPTVSTTMGRSSEYLHPDVAYVSFSCGCAWEEEHGLSLVFIDGLRLGRVSSCDGHETWAHAYADASLLDVVYHPRS